jgi:hypothetical protein
MEELSEGKEICPMGEGSILQKLGTVRLQSTDAATNAVDTAMPRTGQIPHGLEVGFKQVILLTGETFQPLPTAEPEVLRDHQQPGETGAKWGLTVQGKGHLASKEGLRPHPEPLLQVAIDLSPLLPQVLEALREVLSELLQWVATDPSALLPEA